MNISSPKFLTNGLLIVFTGLLIIFMYRSMRRIQNQYSTVIECRGLRMDPTRAYHITDKNSINALNKIRPGVAKGGDILLHYRDQNMDLTTPSYWGSLRFKNGDWHFTLDETGFADTLCSDTRHLPFFRSVDDNKSIIPGGTTLSGAALRSETYMFQKQLSGNNASRYYLHLFEHQGRTYLPWFDEGIKQKYRLNDEEIDTIQIAFNTTSKPGVHLNFVFSNSSTERGTYYLRFDPKSDKHWTLLSSDFNLINAALPSQFEVGDMLFRVRNYNSIGNTILLCLYFVIGAVSTVLCLRKYLIPGNTTYAQMLYLLGLSSSWLVVLGLFTFAHALQNPDIEIARKILLCILVPTLPLLSLIWDTPYTSLLKTGLNRTLSMLKKSSPWVPLSILVVLIMGAASAKNERVLKLIPVLHYSFLVFFVGFFIIYSRLGYFVAKLLLIKRIPKRIVSSSMIVILAIVISVCSHDYSTLLFAVFSFGFLNVLERFNAGQIGYGIIFVMVVVSIVSILSYSGVGVEKLCRFTFTWGNPENIIFENAPEYARQAFAFHYHGVTDIFDPSNTGAISIPNYVRSVSHTDYAFFWAVVYGQKLFLIFSFLALGVLVHTLLYFTRLFTLTTRLKKDDTIQSIINLPAAVRTFLAWFAMSFIFKIVTATSCNLMLPGAILTGISIPFISISFFESLSFVAFVLIIGSQLGRLNESINSPTKALFHDKARRVSLIATSVLSFVFVLWFGLKKYQVKYADTSSTWVKQETQVQLPKVRGKECLDLVKARVSQLSEDKQNALAKKTHDAGLHMYYAGVNPYHSDVFNYSIKQYRNEVWLSEKYDGERKNLKLDSLWSDAVNYRKVYTNGKSHIEFDNKYFSNISISRPSYFSKELSAKLNLKLGQYAGKIHRAGHHVASASILITDHDGKVIVSSALPLDPTLTYPEVQLSFYPASVKKIILAAALAEQHSELLDQNIAGMTPLFWLRKSISPPTLNIFNTLDHQVFEKFLHNLDMSWLDYAGPNWTEDAAIKNRILIGGDIKYSPYAINQWMTKLHKRALKNPSVRKILAQPLLLEGTAYLTSISLRRYKSPSTLWFAKTGTLEEEGRNLSSNFVISNGKFTFSILLDGDLPLSSSALSAQNLFIEILPLLQGYL